ncbi:MAG: GNAT family N-acetyltransferase [Bdellovibrionota bacterium]
MNTLKHKTRFPNSSDLDDITVNQLTDLINQVYDVAESGMWKPNILRTTKSEVKKLEKNSKLILAELNGMIIGSIHVQKQEDDVAEFGMLVCSPKHRGTRIGSDLCKQLKNG